VPSTASARGSNHTWLKWGVPVAVLILLVASAAGVAVRIIYSGSLRASAAQDTSGGPNQVVAPPGSPVVQFSPAAAQHPDYGTVRSLLQIHFDSINIKRYDQWKTTVVSAKQRELPEPKWRDEYATTSDGTIQVHWIEPGPDGSLRVLLTFTSTQDPRDAPPNLPEPCLRWRVVYPMVQESGGLLLNTSGLPGSALVDRC
jgi:hypothetical protein